MAMTLPEWLRKGLEYIGYDWPAANEDVLRQWADDLRGMSGSADGSVTQLDSAVKHVCSANAGEGLQAFRDMINGEQSNVTALESFSNACNAAATGCDTCATVVVVLKGAVIFQLGILVPALATGPGVLVVRQGVKWAIDAAINIAVEQIIAGATS